MPAADERRIKALRFLFVALKGVAETVVESNPIAAPLIKIGKTLYGLAELAAKDNGHPKTPPELQDILQKLEAIIERLSSGLPRTEPELTHGQPLYEKLFLDLGLKSTVREVTLDSTDFCDSICRAPLRLGNCDFFDGAKPSRLSLTEHSALKPYRVLNDAWVEFLTDSL